MIPITKPFLPPREKYEKYIDAVWERNWLTNNGPLVNELEIKLKRYLELKHLLFVGNGTIAIQIAIKALGLKGEIITTPFSYIATTSSIVWENCTPVFVDIDEKTLNIDPSKLEAAITPNTSGILATHVYGNPCDVDTIDFIAKKNNIKVIYDGAHAFGVKLRGKSIFEYGDISTASFHATKLFHTVEGGAVVTTNPDISRLMTSMRNFGHNGPITYDNVGINGKNSEFHAAMGLCNLDYIENILAKRKKLSDCYDESLQGFNIIRPLVKDKEGYNYSYYPIIFPSEEALLEAKTSLEVAQIFPRRYFYPTLSTLDYLKEKGNTPIADDISKRVLCLPLYHSLDKEDVNLICRLLMRIKNYA